MSKDVLVFNPSGDYSLEETNKCIEQIKRSNADISILSADHHVGYSIPIGGVVAHKNAINVSGVGFDIGCGNMCARLDLDPNYLLTNKDSIADQIFRSISFGIGRSNNDKVEDPILDHPLMSQVSKDISSPGLDQKAAMQLGTVGSGNHFTDVFIDELNQVWVGVHFGSRGLGHTIAKYFMTKAGAKDSMDADPCILSMDTDIGKEYFQYMNLAGDYAYAGRNWVVNKITSILGSQILETVHNHHNFAWLEEHNGEQYYVARKGATPAFPGQRGFVGASMGEKSVILSGIDSELSKKALYSTVHGAGRVISRTQAAGKSKWIQGKKQKVSDGLISNKMMHDWVVNKANVVLRGGGTDESPHCYKRLDQVLEAHKDTVKIEHVLTPIIVCMAGNDVYDPFKD